jgi:hypothetical protein
MCILYVTVSLKKSNTYGYQKANSKFYCLWLSSLVLQPEQILVNFAVVGSVKLTVDTSLEQTSVAKHNVVCSTV